MVVRGREKCGNVYGGGTQFQFMQRPVSSRDVMYLMLTLGNNTVLNIPVVC